MGVLLQMFLASSFARADFNGQIGSLAASSANLYTDRARTLCNQLVTAGAAGTILNGSTGNRETLRDRLWEQVALAGASVGYVFAGN